MRSVCVGVHSSSSASSSSRTRCGSVLRSERAHRSESQEYERTAWWRWNGGGVDGRGGKKCARSVIRLSKQDDDNSIFTPATHSRDCALVTEIGAISLISRRHEARLRRRHARAKSGFHVHDSNLFALSIDPVDNEVFHVCWRGILVRNIVLGLPRDTQDDAPRTGAAIDRHKDTCTERAESL